MPKIDQWPKLYEALGLALNIGEHEAIAEECFMCGKAEKLYISVSTGQFHCKVCDASGNAFTFMRYVYDEALGATTDARYQQLHQLRKISVQVLKRHGLAFHGAIGMWLVPFKGLNGEVMNLMRYSPDTGRKYDLPCLNKWLFGLNELRSEDLTRPIFLCEGAFDAISLDAHLRRAKTRARYDILAVPGAAGFSNAWLEYFRNRQVRIWLDNDEAGREGGAKIAKKLVEARITSDITILNWPKGLPDGYDVSDLIRDGGTSVPQFVQKNSTRFGLESRMRLLKAKDVRSESVAVEWLWPQRIPCGSYVTFFGRRGTYKSTIARDLVARVTAGLDMPDGRKGGPPSQVIYFTSEDNPSRVSEDVERFGGNLDNLIIVPLLDANDEQLDLRCELDALRIQVETRGVKLIVVDAQNSFVGAPDISTDMKARHNVSNVLHAFAQQTGVCLIGIRNTADGEAERALGSQSMSDISRCIFRTVKTVEEKSKESYWLVFDKVNDAPAKKHRPLPFTPKDCGEHHRRILWGKEERLVEPAEPGARHQPKLLEEREHVVQLPRKKPATVYSKGSAKG